MRVLIFLVIFLLIPISILSETILIVGYEQENDLYVFESGQYWNKDIWILNVYFSFVIKTYLDKIQGRYYPTMDIYDVTAGVDFGWFIFEFQHISEHVIRKMFNPRYFTMFKVGVRF